MALALFIFFRLFSSCARELLDGYCWLYEVSGEGGDKGLMRSAVLFIWLLLPFVSSSGLFPLCFHRSPKAGLSRRSRDALVEAFGSIEQARIAGEAELRRVPGVGPTIAKRILAWWTSRRPVIWTPPGHYPVNTPTAYLRRWRRCTRMPSPALVTIMIMLVLYFNPFKGDWGIDPVVFIHDWELFNTWLWLICV